MSAIDENPIVDETSAGKTAAGASAEMGNRLLLYVPKSSRWAWCTCRLFAASHSMSTLAGGWRPAFAVRGVHGKVLEAVRHSKGGVENLTEPTRDVCQAQGCTGCRNARTRRDRGRRSGQKTSSEGVTQDKDPYWRVMRGKVWTKASRPRESWGSDAHRHTANPGAAHSRAPCMCAVPRLFWLYLAVENDIGIYSRMAKRFHAATPDAALFREYLSKFQWHQIEAQVSATSRLTEFQVVKDELILAGTTKTLRDWLLQRPEQGLRFRMLFQLVSTKWVNGLSRRRIFPCSTSSVMALSEAFFLPLSFLYNLHEWKYTTRRLRRVRDDLMVGLHFDLSSSETHIYLTGSESQFQKSLLHRLDDMASFAGHPLLLPLLYFQGWVEFLRNQNNILYARIEKIQSDTGVLRHSKISQPSGHLSQEELLNIHKGIVAAHNIAVNSLPAFIEAMAQCLEQSMTTLDALGSVDQPPHHSEMKDFLLDLCDAAKVETVARETIQSRVDMQHKIVCMRITYLNFEH
ncbi:hypothetical protein FH972_025780 [Carpinus fangiana]|uniref:Uncharacterized protein n=1 Tax=Carpinus fangiana TaxID=176857 RepID=A0A5N6L2D8_9ROSI|nr:hypothetical protein FH972_025780 [Carpinus fangiana]